MFRGKFALTAREERGLRDICFFLVDVYVRAWFTAPIAAAAPNKDLQFLQLLNQYEKVNDTLSKVASNKFFGQLWYLSEELIGLAFFDNDISTHNKRAMVQAITEKDGTEDLQSASSWTSEGRQKCRLLTLLQKTQ